MNPNITESPNLALRDYFAIQILNGLLSGGRAGAYKTLVREAYEIADEMIEGRNNESIINNKD